MAAGNKQAILKLRRAILFNIVGATILLLGVLAVIAYSSMIKDRIYSIDLIMPLILLPIGAIIALLGAFNVYEGFKMMKNIDRIYNIGRYGALAQVTASLLLVAGFFLIVFSDSASAHILGSGFTVVGYIIGVAVALPVGMAFYDLGKRTEVFKIRLGAAGYVLIPILGPLVLYFGLKEVR